MRLSSALKSSIVRSPTCWPTTAPVCVTPKSTRPPRWFRKAQTVWAASRRVPVVSLHSRASDSPDATRAAICSGVTMLILPMLPCARSTSVANRVPRGLACALGVLTTEV